MEAPPNEVILWSTLLAGNSTTMVRMKRLIKLNKQVIQSIRQLTLFVLEPNLDQTIISTCCCEECTVRRKCNVMHRRRRLTFPNAVPSAVVIFIRIYTSTTTRSCSCWSSLFADFKGNSFSCNAWKNFQLESQTLMDELKFDEPSFAWLILWCQSCNTSPPVNNRFPSKFHESDVIRESVVQLPVWTHL